MFLKLVVFILLVAESARIGLASQAPSLREANPQGYGSRILEHGVSTSCLQSWKVIESLNNRVFETCNSRSWKYPSYSENVETLVVGVKCLLSGYYAPGTVYKYQLI